MCPLIAASIVLIWLAYRLGEKVGKCKENLRLRQAKDQARADLWERTVDVMEEGGETKDERRGTKDAGRTGGVSARVKGETMSMVHKYRI
jgi:hypothetical protein